MLSPKLWCLFVIFFPALFPLAPNSQSSVQGRPNCHKNRKVVYLNYKPQTKAKDEDGDDEDSGDKTTVNPLPGIDKIIAGITDINTIIATGNGILTDVATGVQAPGNIIVAFFKGIKDSMSTFLEIVQAGKDLATLLGVNSKEHAILVDNPDMVDMMVQCELKTSKKYRTDWFHLEYFGFELKFKTRAPIWLHGLGVVSCSFKYLKTDQVISADVYGGTSHGKDEINLYVIRKPNPAKNRGPSVARIDIETKRVDGRTPPFRFNP